MKNVDIVSKVVSRDDSNKTISGGTMIVSQGGAVDISKIKNEVLAEVAKLYLSRVKNDQASGVIDFRLGMSIASVLIDGVLQSGGEGEATDTNVMTLISPRDVTRLPLMSKEQTAYEIIKKLMGETYASND